MSILLLFLTGQLWMVMWPTLCRQRPFEYTKFRLIFLLIRGVWSGCSFEACQHRPPFCWEALCGLISKAFLQWVGWVHHFWPMLLPWSGRVRVLLPLVERLLGPPSLLLQSLALFVEISPLTLGGTCLALDYAITSNNWIHFFHHGWCLLFLALFWLFHCTDIWWLLLLQFWSIIIPWYLLAW